MRHGLLPVLLALAACHAEDGGGDTDAGDLALLGSWRVQAPPADDGLLRPGTTWLRFGDDDTLQALSTSPHGVHGWTDATFAATADELTVALPPDGGFRVYAWSVDDVELTLSLQGVETVLVRNDDAPTLDDWLPEATVAGSIALEEVEPTDLGWDGAGLWVGNAAGDQLRKLDPADGHVVASLKTGQHVWGLDAAGADLWCGSDATLVRLSSETGGIQQASTPLTGRLDGVAWDGASVWALDGVEQILHRFDPVAQEAAIVLELGGELTDGAGLAAVDGDLLLGDGPLLHRVSTTALQATGSWRVPGLARITGVAVGDGRTWALGAAPDGGTRLVELSLP